MRRRDFLTGAASLALAPSPTRAAFFQGQTYSTSSAPASGWSELPMGGGGFMRSVDVNVNDGTMIGRGDVFGPFVWNGTKWVPAIPNGSLPTSFFNGLGNWMPGGFGLGAYEIVSSPSNSSVVYMAYGNNAWVSTNKCQTWTPSAQAFPTVSGTNYAFPTNTNYDCVYPRIAVDPQNDQIAYLGTMADGVWFTTNGGSTWTQISSGSIPFATANWGHTIIFDPTSAVIGGVTQSIYVSSYGNGLYHSPDGGATWSLVVGSPTTIAQSQMVGANYYCLTGPTGTLTLECTALEAYIGGSWSTLKSSSNMCSFAVDPNNTNRMVWFTDSGETPQISFNGGSTWTAATSETISSTIGWKVYPGNGGDQYLTSGRATFTAANTISLANGTGLVTLPVPTSAGWPGGLAAYTDVSMGLQSLVGNKVIYLPNSKGIICRSDDFPILASNGSAYPSEYYPNGVAAYNNGFGVTVSDVDYAKDGSSTVIAQLGVHSIVSNDDGETWSAMPNIPATGQGCVAASTSTNWLYGEYKNGIWGTNNAGASWTPITISGINWNNFTSFTLVADGSTANTYYLYAASNGGGASGVLYTIAYSGGTWSAVTTFTGLIGSGNIFEYPGYMRAPLGQAGHLFWGFGPNGGEALQTVDSTYVFAFSANGGSSWTVITAVCQPLCFAFGAPAPGQSYPSIYVLGYDPSNSKFGLYRCINFNPSSPNSGTWTLLGDDDEDFAPNGNIVQPGWMDADPTNYGNVVLSTQGQGYLQGYFP